MDVSSIASNYSSTAASRTTGKELDKNAFLKILVTQLANQDPLNPMEDRDFVAQLAQFTSLEELQSMNSGNTFSQASNLVGRNVYSTVTAEDGTKTEVYGKVTSAMVNGGQPYLEVNGQYIPFNDSVVVYDYSDVIIPTTPTAT